MVDEIIRSMEEQKVVFGIKECIKNSEGIKRAVVPVDSRNEVRKVLEANKIKFEISELSKNEIASRLNIKFKCEVFGLRN